MQLCGSNQLLHTFLGTLNIHEEHLNQQVCGAGNIEHKNVEPSTSNEELNEKAFNQFTGELALYNIQMNNFLRSP